MTQHPSFYELWQLWDDHLDADIKCDPFICQQCTKLLGQIYEFLKVGEDEIRRRLNNVSG